MAGSVNKVILVGNLGRDPEIRSTQDGTRIANFTLATNETWRDRASGERKERTEWHRVAIFNDRLVEVAEKYLRKGRRVYLEGQLQTRQWQDQQGQQRTTTEIVLTRFRGDLQLLDSGPGGAGGATDAGYDEGYGGGYGPGDSPRYGGTGPSGPGGGTGGGGPGGMGGGGRGRGTRDELDDEIPF